jgi:hypothetical protein
MSCGRTNKINKLNIKMRVASRSADGTRSNL